jgi:hypothetical protein
MAHVPNSKLWMQPEEDRTRTLVGRHYMPRMLSTVVQSGGRPCSAHQKVWCPACTAGWHLLHHQSLYRCVALCAGSGTLGWPVWSQTCGRIQLSDAHGVVQWIMTTLLRSMGRSAFRGWRPTAVALCDMVNSQRMVDHSMNHVHSSGRGWVEHEYLRMLLSSGVWSKM